jgi:hypothetical protein
MVYSAEAVVLLVGSNKRGGGGGGAGGGVGFEFARNGWMGGLQKTDYLGRFDTYKGQRG